MVQEWREAHKDELHENWRLAAAIRPSIRSFNPEPAATVALSACIPPESRRHCHAVAILSAVAVGSGLNERRRPLLQPKAVPIGGLLAGEAEVGGDCAPLGVGFEKGVVRGLLAADGRATASSRAARYSARPGSRRAPSHCS